MAEIRNPFKPLGTRLRDFARGKISRYVPAGESSSGKTAAPSWASNASTQLDWGDQAAAAPQADPVDFSSFETHTERSVPASFLGASSSGQSAATSVQTKPAADPAPAPAQPKPTTRLDFLNFIWTKREEQLHGGRPAPPETPPSADSGNIQRSTDGESAPPKQSVGRRRRGAVVDVPSPRSPETSSESGSPDTPDSADFFFVGEDSSPAAPLPPSVQAMRAVTPDMPLPSPQQHVQRSSVPEENSPEAPSSAASPWSLFTSASAQAPAAPNLQGDVGTSASTAVQPIPTSTSQSDTDTPVVQRSADTSVAMSAPVSTGEASGILYMPADHVTRSENPSSAAAVSSPASPSIQLAPAETSPAQMDVDFHSQPSQVASSPAQSQPAPYTPAPTSGTTPSIQPSRAEESANEMSYAQPVVDIERPNFTVPANISTTPYIPDMPAPHQPAAAVSNAPAQSPTPTVQLQRDSQPAPARSQSRKSRASQPSTTSAESPSVPNAANTLSSDLTTAYTPTLSQSVQRDMDEFAAPPSMPDAPGLSASVGSESTPDAPVVTHQTAPTAPTVQRSSDPQITNYADLPDAAFNTGTPSIASSASQNNPAAPQSTAQATASPAQSQPAAAVQRKTSASGAVSTGSQTPTASANSHPSVKTSPAPAEYAAEAPTLLTPTPTSTIQQSADTPASTTAPAISRYADTPDTAFNTQPGTANTASTPAYAAEAPTTLEPYSGSQPGQTGNPVSAAPDSKSSGPIQRRRGSLGVSYTPNEHTVHTVQRDMNEEELSAAPAPVWTPSAELAPPSPPSFAAPSPWSTYMEAPAFDEPPKPAPRSTAGSTTNVDAPAPLSGKATVQRKAETTTTSTSTPQAQYSSKPDSSFMSDAPQATSPYSAMPDSSFMSSPAQSPSPTYSSPGVTPSNSSPSFTSPPIQRSVQPYAGSFDEGDLPVHDFDIAEAFNSNFTDQPQAHTQTYNSAQPSYTSQSSAVNAPSISRTADTGSSSSAPSQQFSHNFTPESSIPALGSVEADMLQLLNLPPNTPVAGLKPAPATPEISRMPTNEYASAQRSIDASATVPRYQPFTQSSESQASSTSQTFAASPVSHQTESTVVQRAMGDESAGSVNSNDVAGKEDAGQEQDIDGLAREVYKMLRSKLRDEHERRFGR